MQKLISLAILLSASSLAVAATPSSSLSSASAPVTLSAASDSLNDYRARSAALRAFDHAQFAAELRKLGLKKATLPTYAKELGFDPEVDDAWFSSKEGKRILESILSLQTPSGGWSKRTDMTQLRAPGTAFGTEKDYIPTFDNDATIIQLQLLARGFALTGDTRYQHAVQRGLALVLAAQYPNGGWPQNYPLVGGYHDHITFNDSLFANILTLLHELDQQHYGAQLLTPAQQKQVREAFNRGLDCVLKSQVVINGKKTIWGAQHDAQTLLPTKARAYEMASLASAESMALLNLLMQLPEPSPALQEAIHAALAWYEASAIKDTEWIRGTDYLTHKPGADDMWGRFYDLEHNQPVFGDRDGSVHRDISKVSQERLEGYAWFTTAPNKLRKHYQKWAKQYPRG